MNFIKAFNDATKKFTDYFNYIESSIEKPPKDIEENIIQLNNRIILWQEDKDYDDWQFFQLINHNYKKNYMIYNLTERKIDIKTDLDKIIDFPAPNNPSYSLEFLISFSISAKNWLISNKNNILILHDDISNGRIFCLLGCLLSYNSNKNNLIEPMDAYADIITWNPIFKSYIEKSDSKNHIRYLNYFSSIQKSPIITLKKYYLKSIIIRGAPSIENEKNDINNPYVVINKNSFYCPVLRINSNGKIIYCSYKKGDIIEKIFYSPDSVTKFIIDNYIFGDVCIELLHKGEKSFKQLFIIQFNTFYYGDNHLQFSRDQIDSVWKDIRYPNEFVIDLFFDNSKDEIISSYDENSIKWKSLLSDFIIKGSKNIQENKNEEKNEIKNENKEENNKIDENKKNDNENKNIIKIKPNIDEKSSLLNNNNDENDDKDEEIISSTSNTVNQVQDLLKKIGDNTLKDDLDEEEEDDDLEDYLKSLENKKK